MNEALKPDATKGWTPAPAEPPRPPRRNLFGRLAVLAALAVAAVFVWERVENRAPATNEGPNSGRSGSTPQTVRVAPVTLGDMPLTLDELGTVIPYETVTIRTQIAGKLIEVGFTEGQTVKKGDFLAQIDPAPYEATLAQAKGQLAKDQALLAQAESDLQRYEALSKQDSISKQQVTDQQALVAQDKGAIATDQAQVQMAQVNLGYTHIVSPITGRAGLRLVDPGNYLQPSDATGIVVITEIDPISVVFSVPEDNLPKIAARLRSDAKLKVTVFDRANVTELATGTLETYDSQVDPTTGTIKMRASFANPDGVLFPQQFVNVRLLVDTMTGVTLAPNAAVQIGPSGDFVYVLNADSTVSKRDVVTGPTDGKNTTITSGLAAGDKVVTDGVDRLRDGAKVIVSEAPAGGGGPGKATGEQAQVSPPGVNEQGKGGGDNSGGPRHRRSQGDPPGSGAVGASGGSTSHGAAQ